MSKSTIKKIAVLRANALGDYIFSLPALAALRETYPQASVYYLGKHWHQEFLSNRTSPVDKVIVIPPAAGVGMPETHVNNDKELTAFFKEMRKEKFDIAIQLHGGGKHSNKFVLELGAAYTVGSKTPDATELDETIPYQYYQNEYLRYLEIVSLIGVKTTDTLPHLSVTDNDMHEAKKVLHDIGKEYIVIHPGASDIRRRWPANRFALIGDYFYRHGFQIVVTGSGDEKNIVEEVIKQMHVPAENLYNRLSLGGLVGVLSSSSLVISNDTGPLHVANALDCKTIGLYWCGNMINGTTTYKKDKISLGSWVIYCPVCSTNCASAFSSAAKVSHCDHAVSFLEDISAKDVIDATGSLLEIM